MLLVAAHDSSAKLILTKSYIPLIGKNATALLLHLCSISEQKKTMLRDNRLWCAQTSEQIRYHTCLSHSGLRDARALLLEEGLIETYQDASGDRTTWWSVAPDKLRRFWEFAEALRAAQRPDKMTLPIWQDWRENNPEIVAEFRHLWARVDHYSKDKQQKIPTKPLNVRITRPDFNQKEKPDAKPCRFVEYWNSLPYVPKTKLGTKAYEIARRFFAAHRRYEAGECRGFMLTNDVREKIDLTSINKKPADQDFRTDKEMKLHIRKAACAYDPQYAPIKKDWLGKSLVDFLYRDGKFNKGGTISHFLERVSSHPRRIERESFQKIVNNAEEWELEVAEIVLNLYFVANRRNKKADPVNLYELKAALSIVRKLVEAYEKIPTHRISIFANHFPDYTYFLNWWKRYCEDRVWQGMPITALAPGRNLWRSFVDFVSDDIGWHIFTGERVH